MASLIRILNLQTPMICATDLSLLSIVLSAGANPARRFRFWRPPGREKARSISPFCPSTTEPATNSDVRWTGFTQDFWVDKFGNIREDTLEDNKLTLADDYIVKTIIDPTTGDVGVQRFVDSDADGKADNPTALFRLFP